MKKTNTKPDADRDETTKIGGTPETTDAVETHGNKQPDGQTAEPSDPVGELETKIESLQDSLLRSKADFQNLQRRTTIERSDAIRYANAELMKSLLGTLDDFERSLAAAETSRNLDSIVDGVRLIHENFRKALHAHGLEGIEAMGRPFDPHVHEAILQQPSTDHQPHMVMEEVAKGYRLGDRVLRPTKVIVSKAPDAEKEDSTDKQGEAGNLQS